MAKPTTRKQAAITLDIEKGDTLLGGRFKNIKTVVKDIGTDELGQPTINGKKLLSFRIAKKMPAKSAQIASTGRTFTKAEIIELLRQYSRPDVGVGAGITPKQVQHGINPLTGVKTASARWRQAAGLLKLIADGSGAARLNTLAAAKLKLLTHGGASVAPDTELLPGIAKLIGQRKTLTLPGRLVGAKEPKVLYRSDYSPLRRKLPDAGFNGTGIRHFTPFLDWAHTSAPSVPTGAKAVVSDSGTLRAEVTKAKILDIVRTKVFKGLKYGPDYATETGDVLPYAKAFRKHLAETGYLPINERQLGNIITRATFKARRSPLYEVGVPSNARYRSVLTSAERELPRDGINASARYLPTQMRNIHPAEETAFAKLIDEAKKRLPVKTAQATDAYGDPITQLKPGQEVTYALQHHRQQRRLNTPHLDLRLGTPKTNLFSWAIPGGVLPEEGERKFAPQTPVHPHAYGKFQGRLGQGAARSHVRLQHHGKATIVKTTPNAIHFQSGTADKLQRYVLVKIDTPSGRDWLLVRKGNNDITPAYSMVEGVDQEDAMTQAMASSQVKAAATNNPAVVGNVLELAAKLLRIGTPVQGGMSSLDFRRFSQALLVAKALAHKAGKHLLKTDRNMLHSTYRSDLAPLLGALVSHGKATRHGGIFLDGTVAGRVPLARLDGRTADMVDAHGIQTFLRDATDELGVITKEHVPEPLVAPFRAGNLASFDPVKHYDPEALTKLLEQGSATRNSLAGLGDVLDIIKDISPQPGLVPPAIN